MYHPQPPSEIAIDQPHPKQTHNLLVFGTDYVFFALALGFLNLNVILPAFASRLGASPALVGLLVTILLLSWSLPQLPAGNVVARFRDKKPILMRAAFMGRPLVLVVAALVALTGGNPAWLNLLVLYVAFTLFFGSDSIAAIAWFDILGRAFPSEKRGGYISIWQISKGLGLLGVTALIGYILSERGPAFPFNYAMLFTGGGLALMISATALTLIYEPSGFKQEPVMTSIAWNAFGAHLARLWREDTRLRRATLTRILFSLSGMAFPFYVLYATDRLRFPEQTISIFILAQTVGVLFASLVLGQVADRHGAQRVIQIGSWVLLTAPLLALILALVSRGGLSTLLHYAYAWIYICIGLSENLGMLGYVNYVLDISPPEQRTIYMGFTNALNSLGLFGPIIAGWLVGHTSYLFLFAVSLTLGVGVLFLSYRLPAGRTVH